MSEAEKMEALGRMVFGMLTDVLVMPVGDAAYARRAVTYPTNEERTAKGEAFLLVVRDKQLADFIDNAIAEMFDVTSLTPPAGKQ